ncbi:hypothetical protein OG874_28405 [Nocardia sp. NBC_00565]|uniref:hypothetical protein n=1 Tax=Nocardia sp. NBC_00565 TaxID=2975993 RepID=UPI002E80B05B|nr:hypothetical protein [Nocardia sp. NBC_00565]WUC00753.1 hypothetical protein OG874_28405 [Nocardia sp. NBC_00565]
MRFGFGTIAATLVAASPLAVGCGLSTEADEWDGWTVTVYYTAVESYHSGPRETVRGCSDLECTDANIEIGTLPEAFVDVVRDEGSGRITSGEHAGDYLNWSYDVGFWLDTEPRDTRGQALHPFESAAADDIDPGTRLRLTGCGTTDRESEDVCARFSAATWTIGDEFTPGLGGPRHLDVYIGEETSESFTEGPDFVTFTEATLEPVAP